MPGPEPEGDSHRLARLLLDRRHPERARVGEERADASPESLLESGAQLSLRTGCEHAGGQL